MLAAGWGAWQPTVPVGFVGACFRNKAGEQVFRLIPEADYDQRGELTTASQFPNAAEWTGHTLRTTRQIA